MDRPSDRNAAVDAFMAAYLERQRLVDELGGRGTVSAPNPIQYMDLEDLREVKRRWELLAGDGKGFRKSRWLPKIARQLRLELRLGTTKRGRRKIGRFLRFAQVEQEHRERRALEAAGRRERAVDRERRGEGLRQQPSVGVRRAMARGDLLESQTKEAG